MSTSPTLPVAEETIWPAVGFWLTAFCATAIVAALVLAPRLQHIRALEETVAALTERCVALDRQNEKLARLLQALRHDPELQQQLAQWELEGRPEDGMPALLSDASRSVHRRPRQHSPLLDRLIRLFATDQVVARAGFATAAALYIISLVCYRSPLRTGSAQASAEPVVAGTAEPQQPKPIAALRDERMLSDDECLF